MSSNSGLESYAHRSSKALLVSWFREAAARSGLDGYADFCGFTWRVNRGPPHFGIWEEYPIVIDAGFQLGISPVWDEQGEDWQQRPPTFDELVAIGLRPYCIVDIAIQHKGMICAAIEVRHKHACDPRKIAFLREHVSLWEIPAYWALGQVDTPSELPAEFRLC